MLLYRKKGLAEGQKRASIQKISFGYCMRSKVKIRLWSCVINKCSVKNQIGCDAKVVLALNAFNQFLFFFNSF